MEKHDRRSRMKSESSDGEEDFESADEGDEHSEPSLLPPSLKATSPDDVKNTTSKSHVTKDSSIPKQPDMASQEADSLLSENREGNVRTTGNIETHEECQVTGCYDLEILPDGNDKSAHFKGQEESNPDKNPLDEKEDLEINLKSLSKDCSEEPCELERTRTLADSDITDQLPDPTDKDTIEEQDRSSHRETVAQDIKVASAEDEKKSRQQLNDKQISGRHPDSHKATTEHHQEVNPQSSWGWGSWGTMLSQASAGLSSVIETVESSLGIPEPEEIAKKVAEDEKSNQTAELATTEETTDLKSPLQGDIETEESQGSFFSVFGVPGLSSVVSEGLGALEYIGKKTMDVISDGDPGLRSKREKLMSKGPTLSQILREAKEETENKAANPDKESIMNVKLTTEFDTYQGLAHLEALEILSKESEVKVEAHIINFTKEELVAIKPLLRAIQEVVQIEDEEHEYEEEQDFDREITSSLAELHLSHVPNKTKSVHTRIKEWIDLCLTEQTENPTNKDHVEIYTTAIAALAELTACTVEQFHKIAEVMLLLAEESDTSALVRAQTLKKLTVCVCREVSNLAGKYATALNNLSKECDSPEAIEPLITTLYLESSDSSHYLQHAFKLLCPVLQQTSLSEKNFTGS